MSWKKHRKVQSSFCSGKKEVTKIGKDEMKVL